MVIAAACRSFIRSAAVRGATRLASHAKPSPSPFSSSSRIPLSHRIVRCPVELSVCLETMQPYHSATASALMTSMLTISRFGSGWLPEGIDNTR